MSGKAAIQARLGLARDRLHVGKPSRFLMLVKTYPIPSHTYDELVCCAGIDAETHDWIRMYPVNFRSLDEYRQFKKWQFIDATWSPSTKDSRPESRRVHQDTIEPGDFLKPGSGWPERMRWLEPLVDPSLETLREAQLASGKSLGAIRPKRIKRFVVRDAKGWDELASAGLAQLSLAWDDQPAPRGALEQISYDFLYDFECDDDRCTGHRMEIFDWELAQAYRNFRDSYGPDGWEAKLREQYEERLPGRDLILLVGTHHQWKTWLIVGVIAAPRPKVGKDQRRPHRQLVGEDVTMTIPWVDLEAEQRDRFGPG